MPPTPANVAALTAWLAEHELPLADLRAGRQRLEDVFLRLTAVTGEHPTDHGRSTTAESGHRRRSRVRVSSLRAQTQAELVLTLRRGESLLLILGIPLLLLGFFSTVDILPKGDFSDPIDFLFPGIVALAVMSTGMVQLAIGTAFERQYGVLKRLGITPLGRPRLLTAKTLSIVAIEVVQIVLLLALALALGWDEYVRVGRVRRCGVGHDRVRRTRPADGRPVEGRGDAGRRERPVPDPAAARRHGHSPVRAAHGSASHRRAAAVGRADTGARRDAERRPHRARARVDRAAGVGGLRAVGRSEDLPLGVSNGSMPADLDQVRRLGQAEHGLVVVAVARPDGTVNTSVVNAGVLADPVTGEDVVGFVVRGDARKLRYLAVRCGRAAVTFRSGWQWVTVEGPVRLAGPDDELPGLAP